MDGFNAQSPTTSGAPLLGGGFSIQGAPPQTLDAIRELCKQRFDFFCAAVLGYKVTPFHARMISHIMMSKTTMVLAPRGCLRGDTLVTLADGSRRTIRDLVESKYDGEVMTMTDGFKIGTSRVVDWYNNGTRQTYWMKLRTGRELILTDNHPLFTIEGWTPLSALDVGSRIAVPRTLARPQQDTVSEVDFAEAALLGYLIGDGSTFGSARFTQTSDIDVVVDFKWRAEQFGYTVTEVSDKKSYSLVSQNVHGEVSAAWLKRHGLLNHNSHMKFIPESLFSASDAVLSALVGAMFACDGSVEYTGRKLEVTYASVSWRLICDLQHALSLLGVQSAYSRRYTSCNGKKFPSYRLHVRGEANVRHFAQKIHIPGNKSYKLQLALAECAARGRVENPTTDTIPADYRKYLNNTTNNLKERGIRIDNKYDTSREKVLAAAVLDDNPLLEALATSDLFWDEVVEILPMGEETVYDLEIEDTHNFIANDIVVHNSGKSTIGDVAYALWKMINDPNIRICIASKSGPQAKSFLGEIKAHIESNEDFRLLFGDLKGETWNEDEITISTRTKIRKEPTITAKSVGQGMPGFHFDLIIADDLCDLENTATELQRNKMKQWFYVVLAPTLEPHGEFRVIGTRYHPQDLYGHFAGERGRTENDEPLWNDKRFGPYTLVIPALTVNDKGEEESFWPEYFSVEYLQDKRAEGLLFFNLAYQNDARISEGGIIMIDDLLDVVYLHDGDRPRNEDLIIFQGVDPAIGQKQSNDFFAHATIGIHNYKDIFVLQLTKQRIPFGNQVDYIIEEWLRWASQLVGVETVAYQKALVMAIQERTPWFPVHEVRPRVDKTMRAKVFSDYTRRREVHFRADMTESMTNIAAMPGVLHDDDFDALDIAIEAAKQQVLSPSVIGKIQTNLRRR